jgi:hypothetical protein
MQLAGAQAPPLSSPSNGFLIHARLRWVIATTMMMIVNTITTMILIVVVLP